MDKKEIKRIIKILIELGYLFERDEIEEFMFPVIIQVPQYHVPALCIESIKKLN